MIFFLIFTVFFILYWVKMFMLSFFRYLRFVNIHVLPPDVRIYEKLLCMMMMMWCILWEMYIQFSAILPKATHIHIQLKKNKNKKNFQWRQWGNQKVRTRKWHSQQVLVIQTLFFSVGCFIVFFVDYKNEKK